MSSLDHHLTHILTGLGLGSMVRVRVRVRSRPAGEDNEDIGVVALGRPLCLPPGKETEEHKWQPGDNEKAGGTRRGAGQGGGNNVHRS